MKVFKNYYQKLKAIIWLKYVARFSNKYCYGSIDTLPIYNWFEFHEKGDASFLLKNKRKVSKFEEAALFVLWEKIYDQYLERFGFSPLFWEILKKQRRIVELKMRLITENNLFLWTSIDILEIELKDLEAKQGGEKIPYFEMIVEVEKYTRIPIDEMKISVSKFYSSLRNMEKHYKKEAA